MINKNIHITANLDEISSNLKEACDFFVKNRMEYVEVRTIDNKNIVDYSINDIEKFSDYFKKRKLKIAAIASPLFKWYLVKPNKKINFDSFHFNPALSMEQKKEYVLKTLEIARILDTKIIRIFSNIQSNKLDINDLIKDELFLFAIREAEKRDIFLALENEPICILKTKKDIKSIVKKYKSLKIWFDIANFYQIGENVTKNDLLELKDSIVYFHVKDFKEDKQINKYRSYGIGYVPVGEGVINYKRIISDILSVFDKDIFLSLETHIKEDKINATQKSFDNLVKLIENKRINYAIIGAGRISIKHRNAIKANYNCELRGVFDIVKSKTVKFAKENDVIPYKTLNDLLNDDSIDVVSICTPHDTHIELAKMVVSKNKKVLCEKPFALSKKDLSSALRNNKLKDNVFIVMQNDFNPAIKFLYFLIKNGKLGDINYFSINIRWWRDSKYYSDWHGLKNRAGGSLFNQAIHGINIINRILDLEPISAKTFCKTFQKKSQVEDALVSIVRLKNGLLGNIEVYLGSKYKNVGSGIFISGTKGTILIGGIAYDEIISLDLQDGTKIPDLEKSDHIYGNGHGKLMKTLSNYLLDKKDPDFKLLTRVDDLKKTINFIDFLYKNIN